MRLKATIHGQLFALRLLPVMLLAIGFASTMQLWIHSVDATAKSQHGNAVSSCAQRLLSKLLDAETGARGYVASGRSLFLEPYNEAQPIIPAAARSLSSHVAGDGAQLARAHTIEELSARESAILARYIVLMRAGRIEEARTELRAANGKRTMDRLRREIAAIVFVAQTDATATLAEMQAASARTLYTLVGCIVLGAILAAAAGWQIRSAIRRRVDLLVRKAQRLAVGEDIGPRLGGSDEISDLDRAFHDMAELLAQRTGDLERYRLLAERTQCLMLFARRRDGRILHANAAALAAYRYSLAEMCELTADRLQLGEQPEAGGDGLVAPAYVSLAYEAVQRRSDGSTFPGEVTVEGQLIAGEHVQLSVVRDISERKRTESLVAEALGAAQAAARAKSDFLATMSHEIRTPMNAVIGMTELVLQTSLSDDQREALQIVNGSGAALLRIIDDVLDFSKIEAGKLNVEIIEFSFADTVEAVAQTLATEARARGLSLAAFVDPRIPATLYGDAGRIRQILTNLVGNAVKFTPAGSVRISADVAIVTKDWHEVRFSVRDTGIGIAPEYLERIFQPFSQADASTTRVYGGSGLGLSICRQLVELMGGTLSAASTPGGGSEFSFALRLPASERIPTAPVATAPVIVAEREPTGRRILLAEDNEVNVAVAMRQLHKLGYDATVVGTGRAALAAVIAESYDVVLMDCFMPEMDGYAATGAIRRHELETGAHTPIIALTANAQSSDRDTCIAAGMDDYLAKPVTLGSLREALERNCDPGNAFSSAAAR